MIGDANWKRNIKKNQRLATSNAEAYAHCLLENNYFAWLFEYKQERKDTMTIKTAYELDSDRNLFTEKWLEDVEIEEPAGDDIEFKLIIKDDDNNKEYEAARKMREKREEETTEQALSEEDGHKEDFDEMIEKLNSFVGDPNEHEEKRKIRKCMKGLKIHTGKIDSGGENVDNTNKFIAEMSKKVKSDFRSGKQEEYEKTYLQLVSIEQEWRESQGSKNNRDRYIVDCDDFYEEVVAV